MPPTRLVSSYNTSEEHVLLALSWLSPIEEDLFHLFCFQLPRRAIYCTGNVRQQTTCHSTGRFPLTRHKSCNIRHPSQYDCLGILHHPALETKSTLSLLSCPKMGSLLSFMYITPLSTHRNELYPFHCLFYELASYSQLSEHASVLIKSHPFMWQGQHHHNLILIRKLLARSGIEVDTNLLGFCNGDCRQESIKVHVHHL